MGVAARVRRVESTARGLGPRRLIRHFNQPLPLAWRQRTPFGSLEHRVDLAHPVFVFRRSSLSPRLIHPPQRLGHHGRRRHGVAHAGHVEEQERHAVLLPALRVGQHLLVVEIVRPGDGRHAAGAELGQARASRAFVGLGPGLAVRGAGRAGMVQPAARHGAGEEIGEAGDHHRTDPTAAGEAHEIDTVWVDVEPRLSRGSRVEHELHPVDKRTPVAVVRGADRDEVQLVTDRVQYWRRRAPIGRIDPDDQSRGLGRAVSGGRTDNQTFAADVTRDGCDACSLAAVETLAERARVERESAGRVGQRQIGRLPRPNR